MVAVMDTRPLRDPSAKRYSAENVAFSPSAAPPKPGIPNWSMMFSLGRSGFSWARDSEPSNRTTQVQNVETNWGSRFMLGYLGGGNWRGIQRFYGMWKSR